MTHILTFRYLVILIRCVPNSYCLCFISSLLTYLLTCLLSCIQWCMGRQSLGDGKSEGISRLLWVTNCSPPRALRDCLHMISAS